MIRTYLLTYLLSNIPPDGWSQVVCTNFYRDEIFEPFCDPMNFNQKSEKSYQKRNCQLI